MTPHRTDTRPYAEVVNLLADLPDWFTGSILRGRRVRVARGVPRGDVRPVDVSRLRAVLAEHAGQYACLAANRRRWGERGEMAAVEMMIVVMTAAVRLDLAYPPPAPSPETHQESVELHQAFDQSHGESRGEVQFCLGEIFDDLIPDEPLTA